MTFVQSCACETTKAFVRRLVEHTCRCKRSPRSFPPVSIIVALVVASQFILSQRLRGPWQLSEPSRLRCTMRNAPKKERLERKFRFYTMIRHGVLVDFKNLEPLKAQR